MVPRRPAGSPVVVDGDELPLPVLAASMLGGEGLAVVDRAKKRLGFRASTSDTLEDATHLIVGEPVKRTVKVLFALARGVPLVTISWAEQSLAAGRWIEGASSFIPKGFDPCKCEAIPRRLFARMHFTFATRETVPPVDVLSKLIEAAGGVVGGKAARGDASVVVGGPDGVEDGAVKTAIFTGSLGDDLQQAILRGSTPQKPQKRHHSPSTAKSSKKRPNEAEPPQPPRPPQLQAQSVNPASQTSVDLLNPVADGHPYLEHVGRESCPSIPKMIVLDKPTVAIGRSRQSNDVRVDSKRHINMISRKHCVLLVGESGEVTIKDSGSVNGFFVNGVKREEWQLAPGDLVVLGGGGQTESGVRIDNIQSDCVYRYHAGRGSPDRTGSPKPSRDPATCLPLSP
eukprot:Sspe_Gene.54476::Locus_30070_Transcript_3_7_Confidence_0.222_Length_1427::g.54476::m.54476